MSLQGGSTLRSNPFYTAFLTEKVPLSYTFLSCLEGGVRVCGDAVLLDFWCGFAVIFILSCGITVLQNQAVCGN